MAVDELPRRRQQRIETLAVRLRTALLHYPDGAELVATTVAFRLGAQRPLRQFTDVLSQAGLSGADAEVAAAVLLHVVLGYTTDEQQHRQAEVLGAIDREVVSPDGVRSADDRFLGGVRLIVAGVEAQARG